MRPKSLPISVRAGSKPEPVAGRAPQAQPVARHRVRDGIATLVMLSLIPASLLAVRSADAASQPRVVSHYVADRDGQPTIFATVAVRFDRPVTGVAPATFVLRDADGRVVPSPVAYNSRTLRATLTPSRALKPSTTYTATLTSTIRDASGAQLRLTEFSFRTTAEPTRGMRMNTPQLLRFRPGVTTGIRVDGAGSIVARRAGALARHSWATATHRAVIQGKTYYLMLDGMWAGYYVPGSAVVALRIAGPTAPPATPSPRPSPTSSPRSTPPSAAPSATSPAVGDGSTPPPPATPAPTPLPPSAPTPAPQTPPAVTSGSGILLSAAEIQRLPTSGAAWLALRQAADARVDAPNLADMNQDGNVRVLAKALVYARTGEVRYRTEVIAALRGVMGTEIGGETLALGRELAAYVIAADLIGLRTADPALDGSFREWLRAVVDRRLADGSSLTETHERRANNWGTHAGASRAAAAAYLGDTSELARVAAVFRGWAGDRTAYSGFNYGDLWWQANPSQPVGINPPGAMIAGRSVDGVLPEEQRRTGEFAWPPPCGNYPHGALDGALLTAEILNRAGYPAYSWGSNGLLRAQQWLAANGCAASDDNVWQLPLIDARYGSRFWNGAVVRPGKNFGWTDWLYGS